MGEKTQQNFINIDSQYNSKTIKKNTREYPTLINAPLSSFFSQLQLSKLAHLMSKWENEALTSFIYTSWKVLERCLFTRQGLLLFLVVKTTLIRPGGRMDSPDHEISH